MSYVYKEQTITDVADAFSKIVTELGNAGWILYDDISSTHKVFSSNGETGTEITGYISIYISSYYIYFLAYLYWDNVAHSGKCGAYSSSYNRLLIDEEQILYIAGSKDLFFIRGRAGINYYNFQFFGHIPDAYYSKVITTLTNSATAGDGATLLVGDSSNFIVGDEFQIVGLSEGRDMLEIASKPTGTSVIVQNLPRNYASGASIGVTPMMFGCSGGSASHLFPLCHYYASGLNISSSSWSLGSYVNTSYLNPNKRNNRYTLPPISVLEDDYLSIIGYCKENILYAPSGTQDDLFGVLIDEAPINGDVGASTANTLSDGNKNWSLNEHIGREVIITFGLGLGQVREIIANSSTSVTISGTWTTNPDLTSKYAIADDVYVKIDPFPFLFKVIAPIH